MKSPMLGDAEKRGKVRTEKVFDKKVESTCLSCTSQKIAHYLQENIHNMDKIFDREVSRDVASFDVTGSKWNILL